MNHFETRWKSDDGLEIFAEGWTPDNSGPRAVICLVHGIGEHIHRYLHVAEAFTREGFSLFGADLRGHGRSEGPKGHFPSIEVVLRDIDLLLAEALKRFPGVPLFLYGHSLGGILVLNYGLKVNPRVRGVISTSPPLHTSLEEQKVKVLAAKAFGSLIPSFTIPNGIDVSALSHDPEVAKLYTRDPLVHNRLSFGFGKIMLGVSKWTLDHSSEFPLPLLLLHGKSDTISYSSSSVEFAAALKNNCKVVIWENGYHELHNETFREEVFKVMTDWIGNHL